MNAFPVPTVPRGRRDLGAWRRDASSMVVAVFDFGGGEYGLPVPAGALIDDVEIAGAVGFDTKANAIAGVEDGVVGDFGGSIVGAEFEYGIAQSEGRRAAGGQGRGGGRGFRGCGRGKRFSGARGRRHGFGARDFDGFRSDAGGAFGRRARGIGLGSGSLRGGVEELAGGELFGGSGLGKDQASSRAKKQESANGQH